MPKSQRKTYYTVLEAAIRWCGLHDNESEILAKTDESGFPDTDTINKYCGLSEKIALLVDAMNHAELKYGGKDNVSLETFELVKMGLRTIRHADLKKWFNTYYPAQKPDFLFDACERDLSPSRVETESFKTLIVDLQASNQKVAELETLNIKIAAERDSLKLQLDDILRERNELKAEIASKTPEYMQTSHPYFSTELHDAVIAWSRTVKKNPEPARFKRYLEEWLLKTSDYKGSSLERLTTVANSDQCKRGGAPKKE